MESDVDETFEFWFLVLELSFVLLDLIKIISLGLVCSIICGGLLERKMGMCPRNTIIMQLLMLMILVGGVASWILKAWSVVTLSTDATLEFLYWYIFDHTSMFVLLSFINGRFYFFNFRYSSFVIGIWMKWS